MINPNDVNLLVFDLDGTILSSTKPVREALKRVFAKLNLNTQIIPAEIESHLGLPSEDFYKAIAPLGRPWLWQELRDRVREEYNASLREFGQAFPGVIETLKILRKRGFRLALHSNSTTRYFNSAISALKIRGCFNYVECVQENNLTKTELVLKIKRGFGNLEAAVIGDRSHDIEAARGSNSLSIGVLFGYGGEEPYQADIVITKFSELLDIFDRKLPIFEKMLEEIKGSKKQQGAFVVGISGIDVSGKTEFTKAFARFLVLKGYKVQVINLDDFHNPRRVRYLGESQAENYYARSFDIKTIVQRLLIPIHQKRKYSAN